MKYVIIIPDGAADHPLKELDGRTPFEAAQKPHTDRLAMEGRQGTVRTTPAGMPCGSDVCVMSMLGYDPARYHKGRAPLEAAAMGIDMRAQDWIFRVNLVTVIDGVMQDHSAGAITSQEGQELLSDLAEQLEMPGMMLYPGVSYRNIMVDGGPDGLGRDWSELATTPPHDIPGERISGHLPVGGVHARMLVEMIQRSEALFAGHEINQARREQDLLPATHVWPWGQGQKPDMPGFASRYGVRGAIITAVDLLAGISALIGWDRLQVPGQASYHPQQDYAAAGQAAIAALDAYDLVCVHVEAPDEAAHAADAHTKVAAIEAMDQHIVGPVHEALEQRGPDYRLLYMPDHYTAVATRKHDDTPPPFVITGKRIEAIQRRPFSERHAQAGDLHVRYGHELMEYFLFSGIG